MPTDQQRADFSRALQRAREASGLSQRGVARALGVSPGAVSQWELAQTAPRPATVVKLERTLGLEAGTLGRLLGQLPADAAAPRVSSVAEAIQADARLGDRERELLLAMYRQLVKQRAASAKPG